MPKSNATELVVIYGPMFAGKTTKLIDIYDKHKEKNCIAINYALDVRFGFNQIVSHDGRSINCHTILDLGNFTRTHTGIWDAEYMFINEAQFFPNLLRNVLFIKDVLHINVVLCGLDLDFKRQPFGELLALLPYATTSLKMSGRCAMKGCTNPSIYSDRLTKDEDQILIGGKDEYIPVCGEC